MNIAASALPVFVAIRNNQQRMRANAERARKASSNRLARLRKSSRTRAQRDSHSRLSPEEQAQLEAIRSMDADELIASGTPEHLRELSDRIRRGKTTLTPKQLEQVSELDGEYSTSIVRASVEKKAVLSEQTKTRFCKSDSATLHGILGMAKRMHDEANPGVPFYSDEQLFHLSTSNNRFALAAVFDALAQDPEAQHNHEPRDNPNASVVVHSKTFEIRPGQEATIFAAEITPAKGWAKHIATRDPLEMVLGIDNVLKNGRNFKNDPAFNRGISNTAFESQLITQLNTVQGLQR